MNKGVAAVGLGDVQPSVEEKKTFIDPMMRKYA